MATGIARNPNTSHMAFCLLLHPAMYPISTIRSPQDQWMMWPPTVKSCLTAQHLLSGTTCVEV